jgi:outer membrane protein TolC
MTSAKTLQESNMQLQKIRHTLLRVMMPMLSCATAFLAQNASIAQVPSGAPVTLTLSQAIDLALKQNRTLQLAHLAVSDSERKKEIARSAYFPQIKNESSILHVTELAGVEIPAGAFGVPASTGAIPGKSLFIGQGSATTYTSGTGLVQPLTQMFKIHESNRAATADINTAKIQVNQAEDEITLKVRQLYYSLLIGQLRLQAAKEEINASQVKAKESSAAVTEGRALEVAALESRAAVLDARQAALTQELQIHDLTLALDDLLGLPLSSKLQLDEETPAAPLAVPTREECIRIAQDQNPEIRAAQQAVIKARAGLAAAKDAYIPDLTGLARYSYQSGVPLLVHNFGTFGFTLSYDLFDGGRRNSEISDSRTLLSEAELSLAKAEDELTVQVETAYDKVEQLQNMVGVAEEALAVRTEATRLADRQFEQSAVLASARAEATAKAAAAKATLLEARLGLTLAQAELKRTIGQIPR